MLVAIAIVIAIVLVVLAVVGVVTYNRLQRARQAVQEAWAQIDVMLARRYRLISDLAAVAAGYAAFERATLDALVSARDRAAGVGAAPAARGVAEEVVAEEVERVVARAERYPELQADTAFRRLGDELVAAEDDVSAARRYYNGRVRLYHDAREAFPANVAAGPLGFRPADYFQADRDEREVPHAS